MAKLYYGNGEVTMETSEDIRGIEIRYRGKISIIGDDDNILTMHQNNGILLVSLNGQPLKKQLFTYEGEFKIISIIVADNNADRVSTTIHKVMDYAELLNSNAEDMTEIKVEDLDAGHTYGQRRTETPQILKNLHTSKQDGILYLEDGSEYSGHFHVHTKDGGGAMTGKTHDSSSQLLYIKLTRPGRLKNPLIPTTR